MADKLIEVKNVSKKFSKNIRWSMAQGTADLTKNLLGIKADRSKLRKEEFWALKDISFHISKGETLGIVGINGSGKSTLLRLISGIFPPDKGEIVVRGKIGSLIAVGAGFHPHMTGRENIYLNATILGMDSNEIKEKYQSIVDFADIGDFLESPVSTYSSGMKVRLGFSIAIHTEPEILLIDEILSVGDIAFRNKSLRKLHQLRKRGSATIFVSHNMDHVLSISNRVMLLNMGEIVGIDRPEKVLLDYYNLTDDQRMKAIQKETQTVKAEMLKGEFVSSGDLELTKIRILDSKNIETKVIKESEPFSVIAEFSVEREILDPRFSIAIRDEQDNNVIWYNNIDFEQKLGNMSPGKYELKVGITEHRLAMNVYKLAFAVNDNETLEVFEKNTLNIHTFRVKGSLSPRGVMKANVNWNLTKK